MPEEIFRQERKPISKADLAESAPVTATNPLAPPARPMMATPAFNMGGNPPQAFLDKLAGAPASQEFATQRVDVVPPSGGMPGVPPNLRMTGSSKLEELLAGIRQKTHVFGRIQLPSKGKFYDGETGPTDGLLHIRPMCGEDEQILATNRFAKQGNAVSMIFNNCMQENRKFNSENFLSIDRTYLLIYLRGISYGPDYKVELTCPYTDKQFPHTFNLDLDVEYCSDDFGPQNLAGVLPETGLEFSYRLSTGMDEIKIKQHQEQRAAADAQLNDILLYSSALLIESIGGITDKREILTLLKKLPVIDVVHLRNTVNNPPFGVETKFKVTSPYSLEEFEVSLPLEADFFFPKPKKEQPQA